MTSTITGGATTVTPDALTGYQASQPVGNIIHDILNSSAPAVTLADAGVRTGTLTLFFVTEAAAIAAMQSLAAGVIFSLVDTVRTSVNMNFVLAGDLGNVIETETYTWTVTMPFQEVT